MELVVEGLACRRGGRRVLAGVGLRLPAGRALRVTGANGAGKSTLLRALAGLLSLDAGEARLDGARLSDRESWVERVALAGHLDAVKPPLTVAANLRAWAGIYGVAPSRADAALAAMRLEALADRPAGECSAGQKRRLGLARLLTLDRPLWLLDEPTVSLDAASATTFAAAVRRHLAGGGLALVATHAPIDLGDAAELRLSPPPAGTRLAAADPFLEGAW
jgi:heme exporter protein A